MGPDSDGYLWYCHKCIFKKWFLKERKNSRQHKEASPTPSQGKLAAIADGGQCGPDRLGQ
jgi:hypothetical protein